MFNSDNESNGGGRIMLPASSINTGVTITAAISSLEDADRFVSERIGSDGTFSCYLGEEIIINDGVYNAVWQVVGVDTELYKGDIPLFKHHISLIPKRILTLGRIGGGICNGYANSDIHRYVIPSIVTNLENVLGDHLLERRVKLSNATSSTTTPNRYMASGNGYYTVKANLLCQQQVFGTVHKDYDDMYDTGNDIEQLPGFRTGKVRIDIDTMWLLRDIYGYDGKYHYFHFVDYDGILNHFGTTTISNSGVRPLITIG
jgi:hypothetical protein